MKRIVLAEQLALDGPSRPIYLQRGISATVFAALRPMALQNLTRCDSYDCRLPVSKRKARQRFLYEPFSDKPDITYWCMACDDEYDPTGEFFCEGCRRDIYDSNGCRLNYKFDAETGDMLCVRCYQDGIFERGHTQAELEDGRVHCDWCGR
jgi:hypothetical protein